MTRFAMAAVFALLLLPSACKSPENTVAERCYGVPVARQADCQATERAKLGDQQRVITREMDEHARTGFQSGVSLDKP